MAADPTVRVALEASGRPDAVAVAEDLRTAE
jgi:hypothetical protein